MHVHSRYGHYMCRITCIIDKVYAPYITCAAIQVQYICGRYMCNAPVPHI